VFEAMWEKRFVPQKPVPVFDPNFIIDIGRTANRETFGDEVNR
jgi:hypothetical protein